MQRTVTDFKLCPTSMKLIPIMLISIMAASCAKYAFTLNDQPVYTPPELFSDYRVPDLALKECIRQTIEDRKVTEASKLLALKCTYAGIQSLEGLTTFRGLQQVDLSNNALTSAAGLNQLPDLNWVKLSANPNLDCSSAATLRDKKIELALPEHCQSQ